MRAIVIGFPKSGTSTLTRAFEEAGLRCGHWVHRDAPIGRLVYEGWFLAGDPFALLGDLDALTQMDVCLGGENFWPNLDIALLLAIRRAHPSCLFILNQRPAAATARSIAGWLDLQARLTAADIPGLPAGRGGTEAELIRWIEAHHAALRQVFRDDPRFLGLDIADPAAPARLGAALGLDLPWWGVENASDALGEPG